MTENEAIKRIREQACNDRFLAIHCDDSCMYGDGKCEWAKAIQALEEIQQYRAIGTVEEMEVLNRIAEETVEYLKEDKELLAKYKRIGTIEEFKALKEKSVAKKPKSNKVIVSHDSYAYCPHCKHCIELFKPSHCDRCGGELDWQ